MLSFALPRVRDGCFLYVTDRGLARVLVTKPKALLLDEPLGDLDRLLQLRMRVELRNLQRQLGLMFIHVTHNQEEALSMADRIVVMNDARIQQIADPLTIATRPETELVARFMGDNNIIRGKVAERNGDRVTVLRDGRRVATLPAGEATPDQLIGMMVGRAVGAVYKRRRYGTVGKIVLDVRGLTTATGVRNSCDSRLAMFC